MCEVGTLETPHRCYTLLTVLLCALPAEDAQRKRRWLWSCYELNTLKAS